MFLNDSVRDGEAEACSLADAFSGVEGIINLRDVLGRDTDPVVRDLGDERTIVSGTGRDCDSTAAIRNRVTRVENEIGKDLLQLAGISVSFGRVAIVVTHDLDLAATQLRFE